MKYKKKLNHLTIQGWFELELYGSHYFREFRGEACRLEVVKSINFTHETTNKIYRTEVKLFSLTGNYGWGAGLKLSKDVTSLSFNGDLACIDGELVGS